MIPKFNNISDLKSLEQFYRIDDDWYIAISDIKGSTIAIKEGQYKQVNMIAASSIIAVLNNCKSKDIPYVFGGDGATFLIPAKELENAKEGLLGTQKMAKELFNFDLRVGFVKASEINIAKKYVYVVKLKTNKDLYQSVILGGGLTYAEKLIKAPENANKYLFDFENRVYRADFSGLSCRWQDIPSHKEETVSLLISAADPKDIKIYQHVLDYIYSLHGSIEELIPMIEQNMIITSDREKIDNQMAISNYNKSESFAKLNRVILKSKLQFFKFVSKIKIGVGILSPSTILKRQIKNASDYIKIDDMLRMVIVLDTKNRQKLENFLEKKYLQKKLVYGIHIADRAHMTCIVMNKYFQHIHFIDGADGGYTMASIGFKSRLRSLQL